ncbi:MAG: hypothetical protein HZC48_03470 [Nitrospirae bacterium]|nr:hypothetical protein [Nitrospirota bacterium]
MEEMVSGVLFLAESLTRKMKSTDNDLVLRLVIEEFYRLAGLPDTIHPKL